MKKLEGVLFYILSEEECNNYMKKIDEFLGYPNEHTQTYTSAKLSDLDNSLYIVSIEHEEVKYENIIGDTKEEFCDQDLIDLGHKTVGVI